MADNALKKRNALADLGQGVSRGFWADGLGGPVDMMTTLANLGIAGGGYAGHKLGLLSQPPSLIENPTGGSEWIAQKMRSAGLLNDNPGSTADNYGRVAGGLLAPLTAARAPQIANALQQAPAALQRGAYAVGERAAGMAENQLVKQGGILPATVWHGSPHKFDKFDASKIGTGEGAQAYGHGIYTAEHPATAQQYADNVKDMGAVKDINARLSQIASEMDKYRGAEYGKFRDPKGYELKAQYDALMEARSGVSQAPGNLYKVDLPDEQIAKMLDWDAPLSKQPANVQQALLSEVIKPYQDVSGNTRYMTTVGGQQKGFVSLADAQAHVISNLDGGSAYLSGGSGPQISKKLAAQGIPGIRYLDGGSRGAGQGSSNFVVFPGNEGLLNILERNGQPLASDYLQR